MRAAGGKRNRPAGHKTVPIGRGICISLEKMVVFIIKTDIIVISKCMMGKAHWPACISMGISQANGCLE